MERFFFIISIAMFGSENICACAFCAWPLGTYNNPFSCNGANVTFSQSQKINKEIQSEEENMRSYKDN